MTKPIIKDRKGRPYAKLSAIKTGNMIELDGGFTCHKAGLVKVMGKKPLLYFKCNSGKHLISGQADDGEYCIGIYFPLKS